MNKIAIRSLVNIFAKQQKILSKIASSVEDDSIDVDFEEPEFDPSKGEILVKKWSNGDDAIMLIDGRRVKGKVFNINQKLNAGMFLFIDPKTKQRAHKLIESLDELIVPQDW